MCQYRACNSVARTMPRMELANTLFKSRFQWKRSGGIINLIIPRYQSGYYFMSNARRTSVPDGDVNRQ